MNPLAPTTPATLPSGANWASIPHQAWSEFATGMGTTTVHNLRAHLRRDGLADTASKLR